MRKRLSALWLLLISLILTACVGDAQELKPPPKVSTSIGIYDVESPDDIHKFSADEVRGLVQMENERLQGSGTDPHPVLVYCFEERTFQYTSGKYQNAPIKYRLHTPKTIRSGRKYPLIVHLHGIGEAGSNNTFSLVHLHSILPVMIGPEQEDFFMLVTQCPEETPGWSFRSSTKDGTLDVLVAAIEHVIAENPIDKKRITTTGVSSGGYGVWALLQSYPDLFAGAVPTSCTAPSPSQRLAVLKQTPIWSFVNRGDISSDSLQSAMQIINGSGGSMAFTESNGSGHNAWRPAMEQYDCFRWMLAQKRGSWFSPPPGTIVHKPHSWLYVLLMGILPLSILGVMLWDTVCELTSAMYKKIREWIV